MIIRMNIRNITALCLSAVAAVAAAQLPQNSGGLYAELAADTVADGSSAEIRIDPVIETIDADNGFGRVDYSPYPFVNLAANHIDLNGADWCGVAAAFRRAAIEPVTVVHIGDSHIQADGATEVTRRLLQRRYGNGGRGFIAPLKLAGTNEPMNYKLTSTSRWKTARLLKQPWAVDMQFSGVAIAPESGRFDLTVDTETLRSPADPFNTLKIFTGDVAVKVDSVACSGRPVEFGTSEGEGVTEVRLPRSVDAATLYMSAAPGAVIAGVELLNGNGGVVYSAIGNNGAAFSSYDGLRVGERIAQMHPALVVLSMGTNEAFGNMSAAQMRLNIDRLVGEIKEANPDAAILLVTPQECDKRVAGRRKKRRARRSYFTVNTSVARMRDVIADYGRDNHIAVYDYFTVTGGDGSTKKWVGAGLFGRDHIHLNWTGYALTGQLLGDAIADAVKNGCDETETINL